jgi:hypothetical protein
MEVSNETKEILEAADEFRLLPAALKEMIDLAKKREGVISPENRAQLVLGMGQVVAVMREVADELELIVERFEAE